MIVRDFFVRIRPSIRFLFRRCDGNSQQRFQQNGSNRPFSSRRRLPIKIGVLTSSFVAFSEEEEITRDTNTKITIPEPREFSNIFQMQQAASRNLDSSILLLSSSFRSWQVALLDYLALLERAVTALTIALDVGPAVVEQLNVEECLAKLQTQIFDQKTSMSDSLFVYQESVKMLNLAANISFLVGNESASGLALSHLHNVQLEVGITAEKSQNIKVNNFFILPDGQDERRSY